MWKAKISAAMNKDYGTAEAAEVCRLMAEACIFNDDVMNDEPLKVRRMKWAMAKLLTEGERRVMYLYADCRSTRKVARILGVSHTTINSEMRRIRRKVVYFVNNGKEV